MEATQKKSALSVNMTEGSLWKNMLLFSLPLMLTQVLEVLFNLSDVAIAGKFADYRALGAVGSTTLLVSLFTGLLIGMGSGVNVAVARGLGMGDKQRVEKTVHTSFVLCAAFGWVTGSFLSKKQASETQLSVIQTSGLLMFIGGLQSLVGAAVLGEFSTFSMDSVTPLSAGALLYLVIFGAIIAYTCYFWLLLHTRTVVAISYEYVNPVIGVFLGWLLAGEQVDGVIVTACCLTVLSVFFIVSRKHG